MATSGKTSANDTLIKNLQDQVERLVEQLKDLEECEFVHINIIYDAKTSGESMMLF